MSLISGSNSLVPVIAGAAECKEDIIENDFPGIIEAGLFDDKEVYVDTRARLPRTKH